MNKDPISLFNELRESVRVDGDDFAEAAALATVGDKLRPSVRMVLVKHAGSEGFVFYTNLESRKGRELASNLNAALCFWWPAITVQVRIEGPVEPVTEEEADAYFASRPRGSQIGAWASRQSEELESMEALHRAAAGIAERFANADVPRPPHWSGYRLKPGTIEFWYGKPDRLHERRLYTLGENGWSVRLLNP